jgi:hypothetical protein
MATPLILTELSCWKRFSERGVVIVLKMAAKVLTGTSLPFGPVT